MAGVLPGLPAGLPRASTMIKPLADMEKSAVAPIKPAVKPMVDPVYKLLTAPLSAMGIEVKEEAPLPAEALEYAAKQVEAGKLPVPKTIPTPTAGMPFTLPGITGTSPGILSPSETSPPEEILSEETVSSPVSETIAERVLPEEAKPGGVVSSLHSIEERRRRMWMSL